MLVRIQETATARVQTATAHTLPDPPGYTSTQPPAVFQSLPDPPGYGGRRGCLWSTACACVLLRPGSAPIRSNSGTATKFRKQLPNSGNSYPNSGNGHPNSGNRVQIQETAPTIQETATRIQETDFCAQGLLAVFGQQAAAVCFCSQGGPAVFGRSPARKHPPPIHQETALTEFMKQSLPD